MARSEYSRLRGIAQKRIERLQAAGFAAGNIVLPSAKQLSAKEKSAYVERLWAFLSGGTTLREARKTPDIRFVPGRGGFPQALTEKQIRDRERRERRNAMARERRNILKGLTKQQQQLLKTARQLGVTIATGDIIPFLEYVETRYAQDKAAIFYDVIDDYSKLLKNGHDAADILSDFERYKQDRMELDNISWSGGYNSSLMGKLWADFTIDK